MNHCQKLLPACQRLLVTPSRSVFTRRSLSPWNMLERQMEDMDRHFARMEREINQAFRDFGFPLSRRIRDPVSIAPSLTSRVFPTIEAETGSPGNPGKYCIKIDVGEGFNPEDIKVNLKDRMLTINAKVEKKSDDSRIYQEVTRSFSLPEGVNPEEVKSLLTPEGILTIEAPLPEVEAPKPKEIPISIEGKKE